MLQLCVRQVCLALLFFPYASLFAHELPDPDGKPGDVTKPVQVFILLGQSNMLGAGKVEGGKKPEGSLRNAVSEKGLYPYLVDANGEWTVRKDVRNVRVMGSGTGGSRQFNNEWMTIKGGKIGPEFGIGHHVGEAVDAPVMILKSCIGNRSLGWDLLPPGSDSFEFVEKDKKFHYAGYKESPLKWEVGSEPKPITWYAGMQYDGDIARAKAVLEDLGKYYPDATSYEIAGFFFWQGDKDRYNAGHAAQYEKNLVQLIHQLRKDFDAPDAKFVCATLGQTEKGAEGNEGLILNAQLSVDGKAGKYPEYAGNVASVYTHPLSKGGASNSHYGGNAETYMNVGEAMGKAMVELLKSK
ncbi:MAG: sialate O-acetylesterase [Planctomycetota bacterium]|nr:sialate O-acetylesterase [Planctomycetota bacterium]